MRRFELHQDAPSAMPPRVVTPGVGVVAEGAEFADGSVAIRWREDPASTVVWASIADAAVRHGEAGTRIVWVDPC